MNLGEKIKQLREQKGWNTNKLADESDISRGYMWQLENGGKDDPSFRIMEKLAQALGVSISEFSEQKTVLASEEKLPKGLAEFVRSKSQKYGITKTDLQVLKNVHFRGMQPDDLEDWELLFLFLRKWGR